MNSLKLLYRNKITGTIDPKIYNVIEDKATINPHYTIEKFFLGDHSTILNEVEIVPSQEALPDTWVKSLITKRKIRVGTQEFFERIIQFFREHVESTWSKDKHHLLQHSSGWDSRILGSLIRQIYEERGDPWLGEISFVCYGNEITSVKDILKAEGWENPTVTLLPKDDVYFKTNFDFKTAWCGVNGCSAYPVNHAYWAFNECRRLARAKVLFK